METLLKNVVSFIWWFYHHPAFFTVLVAVTAGIGTFFFARHFVRKAVLRTIGLYINIHHRWERRGQYTFKSLDVRKYYRHVFALVPRFETDGRMLPITQLNRGEYNLDRIDDWRIDKFYLQSDQYCLAKKYWTRRWWSAAMNFILIVEILAILGGIGLFSFTRWQHRSTTQPIAQSTVVPAQVSTSQAPIPTPAPLLTDEGGATILQIDLDQPAPETVGEFMEWLNHRLPEVSIPLPALDIPLPGWLIDILSRPVTVIALPEGIDGFVFIEHSSKGSTLYRTNNLLVTVGYPVTVATNKLTVTAQELKWGVEFSEKKSEWLTPTNSSKGNISIEVTESGNPALIAHPLGWKYHFAWWHAALASSLLIAGIFVYRRTH
jgi:hypothetical protein